MYRKHFGLTRHPFDKDIGAEELFESTASAELMARLKHLLDMRGIGLVTGESGSGSTGPVTSNCKRARARSAARSPRASGATRKRRLPSARVTS